MHGAAVRPYTCSEQKKKQNKIIYTCDMIKIRKNHKIIMEWNHMDTIIRSRSVHVSSFFFLLWLAVGSHVNGEARACERSN